MDAILKALSIVMNENRRNKVFTVIKQLKMREYSKDTHFSLNYCNVCETLICKLVYLSIVFGSMIGI